MYADGPATVIFVTDVKVTKSSDATIASATAKAGVDSSSKLVLGESVAVDNKAKTIKVTVTSGADENDTIIVTAVATDSDAQVSGTATLAYTDSAWDTQTITVTAEDGETTVTYTVSVVAE